MDRYAYLSLTPEALIISMLPPQDFGTYLAVGTHKKSRGQAVFFELDLALIRDALPWDYVEKRCVPSPTGVPKRSVYLSIYRALESVPLKAFKSLYLVTNDGRVLELAAKEYDMTKEKKDVLHLYQELGPVYSRVAASLPPSEFLRYMTVPTHYTAVPKLVFTEMKLNGLAADPVHGTDDDLPYTNMDHLRDCLVRLKDDPSKLKKTVLRSVHGNLPYRTCVNGFFVGSESSFLYYPYPSIEDLNDTHHVWWRSANSVLMHE